MNGSLDHVMFAWDDLDDAAGAFADVGLVPDYGGVHGEMPTEMALLGFDDGSYLELIAPTDADELPDGWPATMLDAGPCRWCLRVEDLDAELDRLRATDATVRGPIRQSRERPDGTRVEYDTAAYTVDGTAWQHPFFVRDVTPRRDRVRPSDSVAATSLTGVAAVVVAVADLDAAVDRFRRLHALSPPRRATSTAFDATLASFPDAPLVFAEPRTDATWLADRLDRYPSWPCAFLLASEDFDASTEAHPLTDAPDVFDARFGWFDAPELHRRVGVVEQ